MKYLYVALFLLLISCGNSSDNQSHPNYEELPADPELDHSLDLIHSEQGISEIELDPKNFDTIATLKEDTISFKRSFHGVEEIDIDDKNNIYMFKSLSTSIWVYDVNGKFKYEIGRAGRGPGEFSRITAFYFSDSYDELYVLDYNYEIEVFKFAGERFEYDRTIHHQLDRVLDFCLLNNDLYIQGFRYQKKDTLTDKTNRFSRVILSKPIHRYSLTDDKIIDSFGRIYHSYSRHPFLDSQLSESWLTCNEHTSTVVRHYKHFPYMIGYEPGGDVKWRSGIKNFHYSNITEIHENSGSGIHFTNGEGVYHKLSRPRETTSKYVVFRIDRRRNMSRSELLKILETKEFPETDDNLRKYRMVLDTQNGALSYTRIDSTNNYMFGVKKDNIVVTADRKLDQTWVRVSKIK